MALKNSRTLGYCIAVLALLFAWVLANGELEFYDIAQGSVHKVVQLDDSEAANKLKVNENLQSQAPLPIQRVERYCNMDGFIKRQQARSKQKLGMLGPEFKNIQHEFSAQGAPTIMLSIYYTSLKASVFDALITRLHTVHGIYAQLIASSNNKVVNVNLVILSSRADYEDYTSRYGFDPRTSQGVFFHGSNSAFVEYKSDPQVVKTAVHEAIHAMNLRLVGLTPRWLNEGMAQLFSAVEFKNGQLDYETEGKSLLTEPYDIYALLASESQWESIDTNLLYYSGWSWLSFMMGEPQGANTLKKLLKKEGANPCDVLNSDDTYQVLQNAFPTFEQAFYDWRQAIKRAINSSEN
ncbi:hypothetical protein PSECIP111951_00177 [Pseudoalteromonas holothuriae]|uniref:DUF1570 domain-containing protein n=1 Tax=Pseudoalteromonas holothuriae TaxID=2963714 RepID=A0A9W4QTC6_9GAMM|nr:MULTISPECIES: DUF1570 domain-containing protein [unclassified Pseudoalteromonas]CAH9050364.1 hypothetical protein PSECIP111951_00177 [Pseudoalteromonas sp. CIP111951]CAH9052318.1 hypothetical protein PSECIP111854_00942 [Pseudoalteromonas sp. CIP111854]